MLNSRRFLLIGFFCALLTATATNLACGGARDRTRVDTSDLRELVLQMRVDDFEARERAGDQLRRLGDAAVPALIQWLHAEDSALTRLLAGVAEEFTTPAGDWHAYAASALGEIGPIAASAIPDLEAASRESLTRVSPEHRDFVINRARAALIKIRGEALVELERGLADVRSARWNSDLETACELGRFGRPLVPVLAQLLNDPNCARRYRVVSALGRIDGAGEASRPALVAMLADRDDSVRWFALRALRSAGKPSEELRHAVAACLRDSARSVREQAIQTLAVLTPAEARGETIRLIEPMLHDPAEEVRARARIELDDLEKKVRAR